MNETIERVRRWLEWPPNETERLETLAMVDTSAGDFRLPVGADTQRALEQLDVPAHAIPEIIEGAPTPEANPEAWWLLERLYRSLTDPESQLSPPWPAPPPRDDALSRYFHLYVFLAAVPHARRLHAERGISEDVTWATLRDVGLQVAHRQSRHGQAGFDGAFWIWQHFRGAIYRLGRLQYNFGRLEFDPAAAGITGHAAGDPAIGVHIPAHGPLTPESCDESFRQAREFFARHFPDHANGIGTCGSWLLDEQLAEYLPSTSNIIRFQQRFTPVTGWTRPGDDDLVLFVFGHLPPVSIDELPQRTTLERAVVRHIRDGRHWQIRLGWLPL